MNIFVQFAVQVQEDMHKKRKGDFCESYIIKFSLSVCLCVCMSVRNRLPNHAYYSDEAFTVDSIGPGKGQ